MLRKVVAATKDQNLHMLRVFPAQGNLALQHVTTPVYGMILAYFYPIRSWYPRNLQQPLFVASQV